MTVCMSLAVVGAGSSWWASSAARSCKPGYEGAAALVVERLVDFAQ